MGPVSGLSLDGTRSALPAQLQAEPKQLGVGGDESGGVGEVVAVPRWDPLLGKVATGDALVVPAGELAERALIRRFGTAVSGGDCLAAPTRPRTRSEAS